MAIKISRNDLLLLRNKIGVDMLEAVKKIYKKPKITKTEQEYEQTYLWNRDARFEAITLHLNNGHAYTVDFVLFDTNPIEFHEVKGGYRLHSYGRARLAFDQARVEFPMFKFVWAEKGKDGWTIK